MDNDNDTAGFGVLGYIACCLIALACWALVGYAEMLALRQKTDAQVRLIEQAVVKLEKVTSK